MPISLSRMFSRESDHLVTEKKRSLQNQDSADTELPTETEHDVKSTSSETSDSFSSFNSINHKPEEVSYPWTGNGYKQGDQKTFFMTCIGTRGDVQPLVVIAQRLMQDGHLCRIACHIDHQNAVEKQGVSWFQIKGFDPEETMAGGVGGSHLPPVVKLYGNRKRYRQWYAELADSTLEAIQAPWADGTPFEADAIISSHQQIFSLDMAEKFKIPLFQYNVFPVVPTKHFRQPFNLWMDGKVEGNATLNKTTFYLYDKMTEVGVNKIEKEFRQRIGLPRLPVGNRTQTSYRLNSMHVPCFGIWSPNLLDAPEDWHGNAVVVGSVDRTGGLGQLPDDVMDYIKFFEINDRVKIKNYDVTATVIGNNGNTGDDRRYVLRLDPTNDPTKLAAYVELTGKPMKKEELSHIVEKEPPVFFGFGVSMTNHTVLERVWTEVQKTVRTLGLKRVIFHVNKDHDLKYVKDTAPEGVFVLDRPVPHDALFSYCKWVVHHGGPGTFHAAFRSGKPNCIVSMVCDHPFWGDLLERKRIGSHVRCHKITEKLLTEAVLRLEEADVVENCMQLSEKMKTEENGADVLVKQIYARFPSDPVDYIALEKQTSWMEDPINTQRRQQRRIPFP